jgi:hypothetical protein
MYYLAKIKFETVNDQNGKLQTIKEEYLVEAENVVEVAAKLNENFGKGMSDFSVSAVVESKIMGIVN